MLKELSLAVIRFLRLSAETPMQDLNIPNGDLYL